LVVEGVFESFGPALLLEMITLPKTSTVTPEVTAPIRCVVSSAALVLDVMNDL